MSRSLPTKLAAQAHREGQRFLEGQTPNSKVPNIASKNTKTKIFQEGSEAFKPAIDPRKKYITVTTLFYVKNVDLISLRKKYNYKEHEEKIDTN
jgi:hypothetical protein